MARSTVTVAGTITSKQSVTVVAGAQDFVWTATDDANGDEFACTAKDIILFRNDAVGVQTVTITTGSDTYGREGAITTYSLASGDYAWFGPMDAAWQQTDGTVQIDTSDADIFVAVLTIP